MTSNSQPFPETDNWFDDEINGLLKDLEEEQAKHQEENDLAELDSLFEDQDNATDDWDMESAFAETERPHRLTLNLDNTDSELEALFENSPDLEEAELNPYETASWFDSPVETMTAKSPETQILDNGDRDFEKTEWTSWHDPVDRAKTMVNATEWGGWRDPADRDETMVNETEWLTWQADEPPAPPAEPVAPVTDNDFDDLDSLFDEVEKQISFGTLVGEKRDSSQQTSVPETPSEAFHLADTPAFLASELDDLKELLGVSEASEDIPRPFTGLGFPPIPREEIPTPQTAQPVTSRMSPLPSSLPGDGSLTLLFYEPLENLEALLATPPTGETPSLDIAGLEAFLEQGSYAPLPQPITVPAPPIPSTLPTAFTNLSETDDEFKDLEALLEQADRTMGGPPSLVAVGGQRLPSRSRAPKVKTFEQTMRVPVKQLDNLSNLIGELVVKRNSLEQDQERLRQFLDNLLNQTQSLSDVGGRMQDLYERTLLEGALLASRSSPRTTSAKTTYSGEKSTFSGGGDQPLDALEMDRFTGFHLLSQEMIELIVRVRESASDIQYLVDETEQVARTLRQVTTQLQEGMTKSRMVPFAQTADRLPRAIREVSMKLDKQVSLNVDGREVLIDKMILEHLYNPMTHLVNNAITHGIESPAERKRKGKPPEGQLSIRSFLQGNQTIITVSDDGAGIDANRVKQKAIEKGLISSFDANSMSEQEVYDLLFHAGFSTKDKADDFSGRGVGLDVVRTILLEIRGSVLVDSVPGEGTTFTIRLPLTLSICKALGCVSDRARIAFPMDGVEDTKEFLAGDLIAQEGTEQKAIPWNNQILPLYRLSDLLSFQRQLSRGNVYGGKPEDDNVSVIILRGSASNFLAVQVDQITGEEEIVIKQIEGPIPKPPGIAGATVRGDGSIMPIGDVIELIDIAQGRIRTDMGGGLWRKAPVAKTADLQMEPVVLIVDDSITVRELLSLSFSKSGYRVEQARDGQEAWENLRSGLPCDLVFCDIEMPRMNGLELLSQLQSDEELSQIPVALLTSRGADRHRKVAAKLGASGYFTKPYTEKDILDAAARMIQGEVLLPGSVKQPSSVLSRFKQVKQTQPGITPPPQPEEDQPKISRVLIIDDSVMVREMLSLTYRKAGYHTEAARDGQDAWEKLRSGLPCDLILCDIEMPRMNGLELLGKLQEDPNLSKIPIAMITSRGAQKMQRLAAEKGAKGYFVKPYIEEALLEASQRLLAGEVLLDVNALVED